MASPLNPSHPPPTGTPKRLIICCDGTWMDSLGKKGREPPSNVTRLSRVLCRTCSDGTHQIINYFAGVGTANSIDQFTGGAFGMGLDQDIREVYNFVCTNYVDGDSIILIGFSRGAFTARSVADMIASIGLLTPEGLDNFYSIFNDYENIGSKTRDTDDFLVPNLPEYNNSQGPAKIEWEERRMRKYKEGLRQLKYTRDTYHDGKTEIRIKALAVWDTVGTLGIPPAPVIGVRGSADQWRFTNTQISAKVENAFQALALDEPRYAFRPSLWERAPGSATNLKQVWFPGNHANVGGGWWDQQISDITLAWMCDQLSPLGLEFNHARLTSTFLDTVRFSAAHPFPHVPQKMSSIVARPISGITRTVSKLLRRSASSSSSSASATASPSKLVSPGSSSPTPWARPEVFRHGNPYTPPRRDPAECDYSHPHPSLALPQLQQFARPWGLGLIRAPTSVVTTWAGKTIRRPGMFMRVDEATNEDTAEPLLGTNERIHSSVRVRLACRGLGLDDRAVWECKSLLDPNLDDDDVAELADDHDDHDEKSIAGRKKKKNKSGGEGRAKERPLWRLERGVGLGDEEEKGVEGKLLRPRELTLSGVEYPPGCMYPVGPLDHRWRWVFDDAKVVGRGQERVPQQVVLPEEPLVGYWERYLLALTVGEADVWKFAQKAAEEIGNL
ncbi:hypothetical protein QBC42DRAFT_304483 [Cladorrhinum samala]|uniref:T6SS Phospholipase effector Tle1-like catalytic domain-containing protein n=1 Tax=Cladorrhinum samala TaxID=585594 RepID=A0AAV9HSU4_9PEZI|nr:hypothetical protein QBC42DRAFT_304483 [Cladorrhinum samala]